MKKIQKLYSCTACGKTPLTKNETGISRKLLGDAQGRFYCLPCLADYLGVTEQDILDKIQEFLDEGCKLFE